MIGVWSIWPGMPQLSSASTRPVCVLVTFSTLLDFVLRWCKCVCWLNFKVLAKEQEKTKRIIIIEQFGKKILVLISMHRTNKSLRCMLAHHHNNNNRVWHSALQYYHPCTLATAFVWPLNNVLPHVNHVDVFSLVFFFFRRGTSKG